MFLTEDGGFQIEQLSINGEGVGGMLEDLNQPGDLAIDADNG